MKVGQERVHRNGIFSRSAGELAGTLPPLRFGVHRQSEAATAWVSGSIRLWRVAFRRRAEKLVTQTFPASRKRECRKFGRDAQTHTRDACAPHFYFRAGTSEGPVRRRPVQAG